MRVRSVLLLHALLGRLRHVESDIAILDAAHRTLSSNQCNTACGDDAAYLASIELRIALQKLRRRQLRLAALCDAVSDDVRDGCYAIDDWFTRSHNPFYQHEIAFRRAA